MDRGGAIGAVVERGVVFNIQRYCTRDGPGIRTTVFLKGCPLSCWWCHNPESQLGLPELVKSESRCIRCGACGDACASQLVGPCTRCGSCAAACPTGAREMIGRWWTVEELVGAVLKDRVFFEESGGGVTLSGGEPLMQPAFVEAALAALREEGVHTALDTCGFAAQGDLLAAAELADLVLYDLKVMDDERHLLYTGVSNVTILDNLVALGQAHGNIWLRIPVIPGLNDDEANLECTASFVASIPGVRIVDLLPYHRMAEGKPARLGRTSRMPDVETPTAQRMVEIAGRFRQAGLATRIGGSHD